MAIFQGFQLFFISIIRWKNLGEWLGGAGGGGGGGVSGCPNFLSRWKGRKKVIVRRTMYCIVLTMIQFIQKINKKCPKTFHLLRRPNLTRRGGGGVSEVWQKVRSLSVCLWWYPLHIWDNSFLGNQKILIAIWGVQDIFGTKFVLLDMLVLYCSQKDWVDVYSSQGSADYHNNW